jgi:hypothetical protein
VYKQKQQELKSQKQEKEKCFANIKEREESQWCNLPKLRKLHGAEKSAASENSLRSRKLKVVNAFLCSPAMAPENILDHTKQCATLLGFQVQSVVTRVNFPTR